MIYFFIYFFALRLDEEAQKRADAENNLVAFRKVKTEVTP